MPYTVNCTTAKLNAIVAVIQDDMKETRLLYEPILRSMRETKITSSKMRTSSVLPNRAASRKHVFMLSAPPSTNNDKRPLIETAELPEDHPGSNKLEKSVSGKQTASNASVKILPLRLSPAMSKKALNADKWSCTSWRVL
jgi:hypothetical protein